jgi:hypothetical protein
MRRREAKNRPKRPQVSPETERAERYLRKSPKKRPIWSRPCDSWFGRTGWWCAQSDTNPSPCYLPNIRVIFEKNSEPAGENSKNPCSTGISWTWRQFDIREEQGAPNFHNSERAFNELGRRRWGGRAARCYYPRTRLGGTRLFRSCCRFGGGTTTRSMRCRRVSPGPGRGRPLSEGRSDTEAEPLSTQEIQWGGLQAAEPIRIF